MGHDRSGVAGKRQLSHRRRRLKSSLRDQFTAWGCRLKRVSVAAGKGESEVPVMEAGRKSLELKEEQQFHFGVCELVFMSSSEKQRQLVEPEQAANTEGC